jgi:hypothetical protein
MAGPDFQNVNETRSTEAAVALVTAFVVGANEVDTVEPDGGELAVAAAFLATVADANKQIRK